MSLPHRDIQTKRLPGAPASRTAWLQIDEQRLSRTLAEFAENLVSGFSIQEILDRLVESVVQVLGVTGAGVVLRGGDEKMHFVAASDDVVLRIEHLQLELGEGPCLEASETGSNVLVSDLANDDRYSRFSPRAADAGLAAVYSFPLRGAETSMGALDLYSDTPRELGARQLVAAQTLADVASAYLSATQSRADAQASEDLLRHRLLHDSLTGLPNRTLFDDRLEHATRTAIRSGKTAALLFLDLDRFKSINDSLGHRIGDLLLVAVAERLQEMLRPGDTVARLSGDEFVVLCENLADLGVAEEVAARIVATLSEPFLIDGKSVVIGVSVGVATADSTSEHPTESLVHADAAMYAAKRRGGGGFQTSDEGLQTTINRRKVVERDLRAAIDADELELQFQPIVETATGAWDGVEALLRWDHPELGAIAPETVVEASDRTGLTLDLGGWVTRTACRQMRHWIDSGDPHPASVAVNVSPPQLMHPDYSSLVEATLRECQLAPSMLCLEITESILVTDVRSALNALDELGRLGVTLALDDFGTGYSSLNYLKRFPVSIVKIDRSFIAGVLDDRADRAIVTAVVTLAHTLGLTVTAEGVENHRQHDQIVALGCDHSQGYHYSRPFAAAAIVENAWWLPPTLTRPG